VLFDTSYDWNTLDELLLDACNDFYESTLDIGKLSIDVNIFNSFNYFYILNLLFRVDLAFNDDLLFNTSYLMIHPKLGKLVGLLQFLRYNNFYFNTLSYDKSIFSLLGTK